MKRKVVIGCVAVLVGSCISDPSPRPSVYNDPTSLAEVFQTFWVEMNTRYLFWSCEDRDWDSIYNSYRLRFDQLDVNRVQDLQVASGYFKAITAYLHDAHFYINWNKEFFPGTATFNPVAVRKIAASGYHPPYRYESNARALLDNNYHNLSGITDSGQHFSILTGTIGEEIVYLQTSGCYLHSAYYSTGLDEIRAAIDFFFETCRKPGTTGIVLDLRNNTGGETVDLDFLVGRLIDRPLNYGLIRYKAGPGPTELTPWLPVVVHPHPAGRGISIPVVVMLDNFTTSSAELLAAAVAAMPNSVLVGEPTYGATSVVTPSDFYLGGSFSVGSFFDIHQSSGVFSTIESDCPSASIIPDHLIPFNKEQLDLGHDEVLQLAIQIASGAD